MRIQSQNKFGLFRAGILVALMLVCSIATFATVTQNYTSMYFSPFPVGETTAAIPVTLTNTGKSSVTLTGVTMSLPVFSYVGSAFPIVVKAGQSVSVSATFTAAAAQVYNGTMVIAVAGGPSMTVSMTGTGTGSATAPALTASSSALSFSAQVGAAAPAAQSLTIGDTPTKRAAVYGGSGSNVDYAERDFGNDIIGDQRWCKH